MKRTLSAALLTLSTLIPFFIPSTVRADDPAHQSRPPSRPAIRENQEVPPVPESPQDEETRLTKNWGGPRKTLSNQGVDLALIYKNDVLSNVGGGLKRGTAYLANVDFRVNLDGEKLVGWSGGSVFFYLLGDYGAHPNAEYVGSAQGVDNIETASPLLKVYELWAQQLFFDSKVSVLLGLHDLNSEFYVTESSGLFLNPSFGIGPDLSQTGRNGPSIFPNSALALRIRSEPSRSFYVQWALFNAVAGSADASRPQGTHFRFKASDGQLLITEAAYLRGKEDPEQSPAKYGVGMWAYTSTFDHLTATNLNPEDPASTVPVQSGNYGLYFLADQTLWEGFSVFARYGLAAAQVNRFSSAAEAGFVAVGAIPGRDKDRLGLGIAHANNGSEYKTALKAEGLPPSSHGSETTIELSYRFEAIPGIAVQPDFQYVIHPDTSDEIANAKVVGARLELSF